MAFKRISLDKYSEAFPDATGEDTLSAHCRLSLTGTSSTKELSSIALGGKVVSVSDEFFAEAFHLILVEVSSYATTPTSFLIAERLRQV